MLNKTLFFLLCMTFFCAAFAGFFCAGIDLTNAQTALAGISNSSWPAQQNFWNLQMANHRNNEDTISAQSNIRQSESVLLSNLITSEVESNAGLAKPSASNTDFCASVADIYFTETQLAPPSITSFPNRPSPVAFTHHTPVSTGGLISDGQPTCLSGG